MKKLGILFIYLFGGVGYAQVDKIDLGYGFGSSPQQINEFLIAGYPVKMKLEGFTEQTGYARLSHYFIHYEILHTVTISEISFISAVAHDSVSSFYQDRNIYSNLSYDLNIRAFPNSPVQFVGGFKANFYFKNKSSISPTDNFPNEVIGVSNSLESIIQPTIGYILGVQTNPKRRLVLNFSFENSFNSYLGQIKYQDKTYKTPRAKIPKYSLFLTYTIFKFKSKKV